MAEDDDRAHGTLLARCHAMYDVGDPNARACYLDLLGSEGDDAVRGEALWRLGNMAGANRALRRAAQSQPDNAAVRARRGLLFLAAHQAADAQALFAEALKIEPQNTAALLGMAELQASRFEGPVQGILGDVLSREPENARANVLLARLYLEVGDSAAARRVLLDLLEVQNAPRPRLDAYALLAAVDHVEGELPSPWTARALELNPRFADIYAVPAYFYVITRRYVEAVALLEQATQTDPAHWSAHSDLGINLLRLNRFAEAREHLERAYAGDPFNAEVVNTLRLLDSLSNFDTLTSDNLILRVHKSESSLLA
ncbi:MAG: tetratricopeptide repeat protein, partial [Pseudomonadales bacterium]